MAVNSNTGMLFSVRSVPRLHTEEQLQLRESLETAVRRVGVSCETVAGQYGREHGSKDPSPGNDW
jgi:hypothetical protein